MDILLMLVTSAVAGLAVTLISRREGLGSWIGDQVSALTGAGIAAYMVHTVSMYKERPYYLFWIVAFSAAGALGMLTLTNLLLGAEAGAPETLPDEEPLTIYEDQPEEDSGPYTLPRAA